MPRFILSAFVVFVIGQAWADDVRHGTYFALYADDKSQYVTVAIDSRLTIVNDPLGVPSYKDDNCKISILGDRAIFFVAGLLSSDLNTGHEFDAQKIAQAQYNEQIDHADIYRIATGWASTMAQNIARLSPLYINELRNRHDGEISQGFFIDIENDRVRAVKAIIQMQGPIIAPSFSPVVTLVEPNSLILSGHTEVLAEFSENHASERAKTAIAEFNNRIIGRSAPEIWASKIEMYVKSVRDWSTNAGVGGDVATMVLEMGKKWRWFHRPSYCPED